MVRKGPLGQCAWEQRDRLPAHEDSLRVPKLLRLLGTRAPVRSHWSPAQDHTDPPLGKDQEQPRCPLVSQELLGAVCPDASLTGPSPADTGL